MIQCFIIRCFNTQ